MRATCVAKHWKRFSWIHEISSIAESIRVNIENIVGGHLNWRKMKEVSRTRSHSHTLAESCGAPWGPQAANCNMGSCSQSVRHRHPRRYIYPSVHCALCNDTMRWSDDRCSPSKLVASHEGKWLLAREVESDHDHRSTNHIVLQVSSGTNMN